MSQIDIRHALQMTLKAHGLVSLARLGWNLSATKISIGLSGLFGFGPLKFGPFVHSPQNA
jgi:hypothetical protein